MTNPDSILKSRDITLPTKVCIVRAMVFPGVMWKSTRIDSYKIHRWEREKYTSLFANNMIFYVANSKEESEKSQLKTQHSETKSRHLFPSLHGK